MQTLLDHAAVDVRCDENLDDTNTTGSIPPHYLLENKRTFEEVCLCGKACFLTLPFITQISHSGSILLISLQRALSVSDRDPSQLL